MGGVPRNILKEDAIPTLFCFTAEKKKRPSSEARSEKNSKRQFLEQTFAEYETVVEQIEQTESNKPVMIDKSIGMSIKSVSRGTQYRQQSSSIPSTLPAKKATEPTKIKFIVKKTKEKGQNTDISFPPYCNVSFTTSNLHEKDTDEESESSSDSEEPLDNESLDPTFQPQEDDYSNTDTDTDDESAACIETPKHDSKLIVYWSCLLQLLSCLICHNKAAITKIRYRGSMVILTMYCVNNHETVWHSQPDINGMAAGNLILASAILFSGNSFQPIMEFLKIANVHFMSATSFHSIQKKYLFPAVHHVYTTCREIIFGSIRDSGPVDIIGDGRCDSPGYSAKFGTYTCMNSENNQIIDFNVSHCRIAGNSNRMELFGMKGLIERLINNGIQILSLTTDRHTQIRKYMRSNLKEIKHQFDIWHVGKNIKKKLAKAAKLKRNKDLQPWIKSIINHFWWCCKTCEGNEHILREKWLSILDHITNKHSWKGNKYFKRCAHDDKKLNRKWLKKNSSAYRALEKIVGCPKLLADLKYLTDFKHTGTLEVYHSLYNKYCPKRLCFSYEGMVARTQLAVMDHNSSVGLGQAQTKSGEKRFKLSFSRVTQSWVTKKITEPKDKSYINNLLDEVIYLRTSGETYSTPKLPKPPKNIATETKPDKKEAIKNSRSRFQ